MVNLYSSILEVKIYCTPLFLIAVRLPQDAIYQKDWWVSYEMICGSCICDTSNVRGHVALFILSDL